MDGSMPLFMLRDGALRRCAVVPNGLKITTFTDRHQRLIHMLLDGRSERILLQAQPNATACPDDEGGGQ